MAQEETTSTKALPNFSQIMDVTNVSDSCIEHAELELSNQEATIEPVASSEQLPQTATKGQLSEEAAEQLEGELLI